MKLSRHQILFKYGPNCKAKLPCGAIAVAGRGPNKGPGQKYNFLDFVCQKCNLSVDERKKFPECKRKFEIVETLIQLGNVRWNFNEGRLESD